MSNAVGSITLASQSFPAGTTAGSLVCTLINAANAVVATQSVSATASATSASVTFASVAPGTYTVSVQRQDASGNNLGSPAVSTAFTVPMPPVLITVPSAVIVALQ